MILIFEKKKRGNTKKKTEKEMLEYVQEYKKEKKENNQIYNGRKKDDNLQVKVENKILLEMLKSSQRFHNDQLK